MATPMMKCGHAANATSDGKPCCVICAGITPGAFEIDAPPDLVGRTAKCSYGDHGEVPSSTKLAFFEHNPAQPHDTYYCGCHGWN